MHFRSVMCPSVLLRALVFWAFCPLWVCASEQVASPDGKIVLTFDCAETGPVYSVTYCGKEIVAPSALGLVCEPAFGKLRVSETTRQYMDRSWAPVWGEYAKIPEHFEAISILLKDETGQELGLEFRVFNEGFAFRYLRGKTEIQSISSELTEFRIPSDVCVYPIDWTEATFPEDGLRFEDFKSSCPPLTGKFSDGKVFSIMEACAVNYPRLRWVKNGTGAVQPSFRKTVWMPVHSSKEDAADGNADGDCGGFCGTPWRAMMLAENEAQLAENGYFVLNLNPEPVPGQDFSWVRPGKTISNEMNCQIRKDALFSMVDFAAENGIRYVQIDWGWYGTEYVYSEAECAEWAKNNPEHADDPTWRANTKPDPRKAAKGRIPYFPQFHASTYVDVEIEELVAYAREKGVGICLYINDRILKAYDIEELFALYEKWGIAGLKPGFVAYGSAQDTQDIRRLCEVAAKHRLWLCIHDAYLPDGSMRTFPNVMNVEGGGGQEGNHPAFHDTVLPFTRCLAGPFDFTPAIFFRGRSNCHQLSLLVTLYAPSHVIRSGWGIRNRESGSENSFGSEKEWFAAVGSEWVNTKVLDAEIGRRIVTVRETKDGEWFLGATNGSRPHTSAISLSFLKPDCDYELQLWTDAPDPIGEFRGTVKTVRTVRSTDRLDLPMAENGGAVARFIPK